MPGWTLTKMYRPVSLVIAVREALVAVSSSVTSAPGTTAFCGSVTWPETEPAEVDCAQAGDALRLSAIPTQTTANPKRSRDTLICNNLSFRII